MSKQSPDEKMDDLHEDIYTDEGAESLEENDEISPGEEGFMEGETSDGEKVICSICGKIISDEERVVEREIHGKVMRFCSLTCAEKAEVSEPVHKSIKPSLRIGEKKEHSSTGMHHGQKKH